MFSRTLSCECVKPVCRVQTAAEREASSSVEKLGQQLQNAKSELGSIKQELQQAQSSGTCLKTCWRLLPLHGAIDAAFMDPFRHT